MQISMFDGVKPFKITKPIRLIELFAGIGAQAKALENQNIGILKAQDVLSQWFNIKIDELLKEYEK